jgi:hypothetical protein
MRLKVMAFHSFVKKIIELMKNVFHIPIFKGRPEKKFQLTPV